MSKEEGNIFTFAVGLISGMVTGVVLGLLSAPKTGDETREGLAYKISNLKEKAKGKFSKLQEYGKDGMTRVKSDLQERASVISSKLDELAKRGSDVLIQDEIQ
ncbi:MAG: YtxH domain-containing protein [Candidatus Melainabacteria bacterium]|nr:YtxH domain-containing protein [Candidatus Melainabacteria bacterium]MBI3307923.1 YtxH domain-containing protein [Candidatus Melainabacteria bacterium]